MTHKIIIETDDKEFHYEYIDYETIIKEISELFSNGFNGIIKYDLDLEKLKIDELIHILNLNPNLPNLENPDQCKTAKEYREWLKLYEILIDIDLNLN